MDELSKQTTEFADAMLEQHCGLFISELLFTIFYVLVDRANRLCMPRISKEILLKIFDRISAELNLIENNEYHD